MGQPRAAEAAEAAGSTGARARGTRVTPGLAWEALRLELATRAAPASCGPVSQPPADLCHCHCTLRRFEPVIVLVHFHGVLKSGTVELTKFPQGKL